MKKLISLFLVVALMAVAVPALANDGEYITDMYRNVMRYSTEFAPNQFITVSLGTKGASAQPMAGVSQYQFRFVNTSDLTTDAFGTVLFGTGTTWNATGYGSIVGGDRWTVGKGVTNITFAAYSSPTPKTLKLWLQKR